MYTLGIDIGSSSSKAVLLKNGSEIIAEDAIQAGTGSSGPSRVLQQIMQQYGLELNEIDYTIATGYGRFSVAFANEQISEITCHAKGIAWLLPGTGTIIDIGGQDAKAISLDSNGNILKFFMNDKCAAGTGRFLDVMSRVLETELSEMGEWHFRSAHPAKVSSTCTVFAESEVISLLSQGIAKEDIIAGIHASVAAKACALAYRTGVRENVVMCGGVAQNAGVVDAISKELDKQVIVAPHPQLTGALGAALIAAKKVKEKENP